MMENKPHTNCSSNVALLALLALFNQPPLKQRVTPPWGVTNFSSNVIKVTEYQIVIRS